MRSGLTSLPRSSVSRAGGTRLTSVSRRTARGRRRRVGLQLALVGPGTFSAAGLVTPTHGLTRVAIQLKHGSTWVTTRRNVKIVGSGAFAATFRVPPTASTVTVRVVATGRAPTRVVSGGKTLHLGSRGAAAFSVPASTRLYPGTSVRSVSAGPSGETVLQLTSSASKPVVGGHIAVGPSSALPFGMFGTVLNVSGFGTGWHVGLSSASIDQVFENVSMHFDQAVTPMIVDALGRPVAKASRAGSIRISGAASFAHTASLNSVFECKSSGKPQSADLGFSSIGPMPLSIQLSNLHALDQFDLGSIFPHRDPFFLMQVHGEAQATIGFAAKTAFTCTLSNSFRENHRIAIPLGAVGPVPVTMYLEPTLTFGVSESGNVSLSQHHYWAITLEQDGFSPFSAKLAHSADPPKVSVGAALSASLFAGGDISVMFGAGEGDWAVQAGIYGEFGPDFELAASTDQPGCVTATAKLEANLGVRLQVLVKRWSAQLASLTTHPVDLGGPWCVGGGSGGSGGGNGGGGGGGGGPGSPENGASNGERVAEVSGGSGETCARLADSTVDCLGLNLDGQVGDGSTESKFKPTAVAGLHEVTAISVGGYFACALLAGGTADCWGWDGNGELGNGEHVNYSGPEIQPTDGEFAQPHPVTGLRDATQISTGETHACAVIEGGTIECWGSDKVGQLGLGSPVGLTECYFDETYPCSTVPVPVKGITEAVQVVTGQQSACALLRDGTVECWGWNYLGQLGDGGTEDSPVPVVVRGVSGVRALAAGDVDTCAVTSEGAVYCWGFNEQGQLGNGILSGPESCIHEIAGGACSTVPAKVRGISNALDVTVGGLFGPACALTATGGVKCWGPDEAGELGNGAKSGPQVTPVEVVGLPEPMRQVQVNYDSSASQEAACAISTGERLYCWGADLYAGVHSDVPVEIAIPSSSETGS
jgi:alpha-tubulin suppressor-like RCC1 family protein